MSNNKQAKKNKEIKVVTKIDVKSTKSKRKRNKKMRTARVSQFSSSVIAPFSRAAEGAKVPDGHPISTSTFVLTQRLALTTDASGELDVVVFPNLETSVITTRDSLGVTGTSLNLANEAVTAGVKSPVAVTGKTGYGFDSTNLSTVYSKYRIVSYGVRARASTALSTSGEVIAAVHPIKGLLPARSSTGPAVYNTDGTTLFVPSYVNSSGPRSTMLEYLLGLGLPCSGSGNAAVIDASRMTNLPHHAIMSVTELSARGLHARALPFEGSVRDFRTTRYFAVGTDSIDVSPLYASSAAQQFGVDMSTFKCGGHESFILHGSNLPASTQVLNLELVYHIEAIPNPNLQLMHRATGPVAPPTPATLDTELVHLHRVPRLSFADTIKQVGDSLLGELEGRAAGAIEGAAKRGLNALGGILGRLAISSV